jgi:TetR/AcrR family transcriptional regulator
MTLDEYTDLSRLIVDLEREGRVTRTFRRLDAERQQAIIRAIFDESIESGPEALNIKNVARRAGVAVGSLYQYFGSRDGLLDFAIELVVRVVRAGFDQYRPYLAALPLREALAAYGTGGMDWASEAAGFSRFFARAAYGGDPALAERVVRPVAETLLEMVGDILAAAQARGEVRADIDLQATTRAIHALTLALYDPLLLPYLNVYFQIGSEGMAPERTIEAAMEMIFRGLQNPPARLDSENGERAS